MIRINLLPVREARRRADLQQQGFLVAVLVVGALALTIWVHLAMRSKIEGGKERVAEIDAQIKQFEPQLKQVEAYKKKKAEVEAKLGVIKGLERSRSGPVHMMDELANATQDRMWITELESSGAHIRMEGRSLDNEIVATFLTQLNNSPYFGGVELKRTELEARGGLKLHQFEVTATIEDPHADETAPTDPNGATTAGTTGGGASGN
jgi:type IV pilus assembly protein PilN